MKIERIGKTDRKCNAHLASGHKPSAISVRTKLIDAHTHTHECHVADLFFSFVESAACQRRCHRINEYIREKIKADRKKEKNLKPTTANDTTIDMVTRPSQVDHQIV